WRRARQQGDRPGSVRVREDGRRTPLARLREAGGAVQSAARPAPLRRRVDGESPGVSLVSVTRRGAYRRRMAECLVELYVSREDPAAVESGAERARAAADQVTEEGAAVRYVRVIFVPEDETCFFLYEAASAEAVRDAACRAGLSSGRITEAL